METRRASGFRSVKWLFLSLACRSFPNDDDDDDDDDDERPPWLRRFHPFPMRPPAKKIGTELTIVTRYRSRDRFGSSVKSRTFRDVVTKLRALQLQTPNSPYDPALFRKPQSLYSWDDRATRFCGTSAPTENSTPKLHFLRCGEGFPRFEDNAKLLIFPAC
ncbi:hypothetical protein K0M31_020311 [Melipona bicolor]|uniref:Uncharacterized protein n=1 Tax=Melipona bicolor TaxID=60889 RepID=A0AA40G1H8_9HYME|nr:hypothetical protein K0M31_020311 [Melipona bicolor]